MLLNLYLVQILPSPSCSATAIAYKLAKIMANWEHNKWVLGIFSLRKHRNGYLGASDQKSDPAILSSDLDFL